MNERLAPETPPVTLNTLEQVSDLINSAPTLQETRNRFQEIFFHFREDQRAKRHEQRVKVLKEAQDRGVIVFNDRIQIDL